MFGIFNKKQKNNKKAKEKLDPAKIKEKEIENEIENNIDIYVMPKHFRSFHDHKNKAKKTGLVIFVSGILFTIALLTIGALYYFQIGPFKAGPIATSTDIIIDDPNPQPTCADGMQYCKTRDDCSSQGYFWYDNKCNAQRKSAIDPNTNDPKGSYLVMKVEFDKVENFNDFERAILKYGSKSRIEKLENEKKQVEGKPESFRENIVSLVIQLSLPKSQNIKNIKVEKQDDRATVTALTRDETQRAEIKMVREDERWKLDSESWVNNKGDIPGPIDVGPVTIVVFKKGDDTDRDGLTDKEEIIFGSDPESLDSDGDGYSDLDEILNMYSPVGPEKLIEGSLVSRYENNQFNYELIYPVNWVVSSIGGDESVIIKSSDNHFIQIISQANSNKRSIDDWFKAQFNVSSIDNSNRINAEDWQGIKNEDSLTIYLIDNSLVNIFTITYNPGNNDTLEYKNIYDLVISSFKIK